MVRKIESQVDGHFCPWCGLPSVRITKYDDSSIESFCLKCEEHASYTITVSGPDMCKATLRPQKPSC